MFYLQFIDNKSVTLPNCFIIQLSPRNFKSLYGREKCDNDFVRRKLIE